MNEFKKLQDALKGAGIPFEIDQGVPAVDSAPEFLIIRKSSGYLIDVEWRARGGFGISSSRRNDPPSGFDEPDEMYRNAASAALRITELWATEGRTDASKKLAVAELRLLRGMTQKSLAEILDVDVSVITKRESVEPSSMRVDTLKNLVEALGGELEVAVRVGNTRRLLQI
jgi:hypothetical protein